MTVFEVFKDQTSSIEHQEYIHHFFLNCDGILHHELLWPRHMFSKQYYAAVLQHLQEKHHEKGKMETDWLVHHDNVPTQIILSAKQFVGMNEMAVVLCLPHLPGTAPNYFMILKMKLKLEVKDLLMSWRFQKFHGRY